MKPKKVDENKESKPKKAEETLTTRTGGAYIPPAKLRMMQAAITDKSSKEYQVPSYLQYVHEFGFIILVSYVSFQRLAWEALKKSINGLINKVNTPNISIIVRELFAENIVRGRGLLCQAIMQVIT